MINLKPAWRGRAVAAALLVAAMSTGAALADDAADVGAAVEKLRAAMLGSDGATLQTLVSPDLSYGHSSGKIEDHDAFIKALDGTNSFKSLELSDQTVKIVGDDAIVRHTFDAVNNLAEGKTSNSHIGVLQVWTKDDDAWKLLARQAFVLPK